MTNPVVPLAQGVVQAPADLDALLASVRLGEDEQPKKEEGTTRQGLQGSALGIRGQTLCPDGCRRIQASCPGIDLPQIHLRHLRGAAAEGAGDGGEGLQKAVTLYEQ